MLLTKVDFYAILLPKEDEMTAALFGIFLGFLYVSMCFILWENCDRFGKILGALGVCGMVAFLSVSAVETDSPYILFWFAMGYLFRFALHLVGLIKLWRKIRLRKAALRARS